MNKLSIPNFNVLDILLEHEKNTRATRLKNINTLKIELPKHESIYYNAGSSNKLQSLMPAQNPLFDELPLFYGKLRDHKELRGKFYDTLINTVQNSPCPYCMIISNNYAIDHYLPKSIYKEFSITPYNLIPVCMDCNFNKHDSLQEIVHPYFHCIINTTWLYARIEGINPFTVSFYCNQGSLSDKTFELLKSHLEVLNLSNRYASQVSNEIASRRYLFHKTLESSDSQSLRGIIKREYLSSYKCNKNSWKTALYRLLLTLEHEYVNI